MAAWTYFEGAWHEGNPKIMGPLTQAAWLCCTVFDGARAFEGQAPDLDLHCQRVVRSARMGRNPQTGEKFEIAETNAVKLTAGSKLKAAAKG